MGTVIGINAKLFRGVAGTTAATEMKNVKDVNLDLDKVEIDVTTRKSGGWRDYVAGLKDASLEFDMKYDTADANYKAMLQDKSLELIVNAAVALFVSDGEGNGMDADWVITKFSVPQELEDAVKVSVSAKPSCEIRNPVWVGES